MIEQLHDSTRRALALRWLFQMFGFDNEQLDIELATGLSIAEGEDYRPGRSIVYMIITVRADPTTEEPTCCALAGSITEEQLHQEGPLLHATWNELSQSEQKREIQLWIPPWEAAHFAKQLHERGVALSPGAMEMARVYEKTSRSADVV